MSDVVYSSDVDGLTPADLRGFFDGWPNPPTPETHLRILRRSTHVWMARDGAGGPVIGFVNALSDGVLAAFIPLLEVRPERREALAKLAWEPREPITQGGLLKYVHGGEYHCYNPDVIATLQAAVRSGDYDRYRAYAELVNKRPVSTLRDLMDLQAAGPAVPLDEVEPVEAILPRFDSAGMSLGALSPEAHEALAIAMNRIGA